MHELSLTRRIVALCSERAGGARVASVRLKLGRLTCVQAHALRFCFDLCASETGLAGAALVIEEIAGRARCQACGANFPLDDLLTPCGCGSFERDILAGEELDIEDMELMPCVPPAAVPILPA